MQQFFIEENVIFWREVSLVELSLAACCEVFGVELTGWLIVRI
jgi:hypothetical protein